MKNFDALKWLCLLSLIGFIYCFVSDIGYFFLFVDDLSVESEKSSFLNFEFQASWPYFTGIALVMFPLFNNMIHLVYVLLFMSQRAQLK